MAYDLSLQNPRCVYQLLKKQYEKYTPENVSKITGADKDKFLKAADIFTSVRDLHTNYLLPAPFNEMTAFLPFMVEDYVDHGKRRYLVSHVAEGFRHLGFVDDHAINAAEAIVYDALYAYCQEMIRRGKPEGQFR